MLLRPESFLPLFFSFLLSFVSSFLAFFRFFLLFPTNTVLLVSPFYFRHLCIQKVKGEFFLGFEVERKRESKERKARPLSLLSTREERSTFVSLSLSLSFSFSSFSLHTPAADIFLPLMPPAALSAPTRGDAGPARGGGGSNQGRNANTNNAAAANANAPPPEEPLADGGILPRDAALIKGLLRSMVR